MTTETSGHTAAHVAKTYTSGTEEEVATASRSTGPDAGLSHDGRDDLPPIEEVAALLRRVAAGLTELAYRPWFFGDSVAFEAMVASSKALGDSSFAGFAPVSPTPGRQDVTRSRARGLHSPRSRDNGSREAIQ